jgi:hypothetical protein
MEQRTCKVCGLVQSVEEFPLAGVVKGKRYYRHKCTKCYSKIKLKYKHSQRDRLTEHKKSLKCSSCDISDHRVLQFHHHNNDKEFNVGEMVRLGFSFKKIMEEVKKCEVLCANCHSIIHYEERKGKT